MNKGYAFGFLIVLLVVLLGLYVSFTAFMSSRDALRTQAAAEPGSEVAQSQRVTLIPPPTVAATPVPPTPLPGEMGVPTVVVPTPIVEPTLPTEPPAEPPAPAPTEPPPALPSDAPPPVAPPPTPVPAPAYQFRLAGPPSPDPNYASCCYIFGVVRDAAGNGLEGILVQAFNEWNTLPPAATKGGGEAGQYNIPIGSDQVTWYVAIVDAAGGYISSQSPLSFDPAIANGFRVDWQRTY
jgi:hypothetical protein